jgi:hypothetical protein
MGEPADIQNPRKTVLACSMETATSEMSRGKHRPARLYQPADMEVFSASREKGLQLCQWYPGRARTRSRSRS